MKNVLGGFMRTFRSLASLHSAYEDLLAYRDGELGRFGRWCVGTHLGRCTTCQREAELIEHDLRAFKKMDHLFYASDFLNLPEGLGKLHKAIEDWEARNLLDNDALEPDRAIGEVVLRQVATEFDLYLGNRATAAFLLKMGSRKVKDLGLLVEAEAVLRDFLGPRAASAVAQRILHVRMSVDRSIQGSLPA